MSAATEPALVVPPIATPAPLWHYTCEHAASRLRGAGILHPHIHPFLGYRLVWLTDLPVPDAEGLGLTADLLRCDRTEVRYEVTQPDHCYWWPQWAEDHLVDRSLRSWLTLGRKPQHWWLSERPQIAVRS